MSSRLTTSRGEKNHEAFRDEVKSLALPAVVDSLSFVLEEIKRGRRVGTLIVLRPENSDAMLGHRNDRAKDARRFEGKRKPSRTFEKNWNKGMLEYIVWQAHIKLSDKEILILEDPIKAGTTPKAMDR